MGKSSIEKDIVSNTTDNIEIEKSDRGRALDIALKYNFVTDVTSLVVRKPNEDKNETFSMIESESQEDKDNVLPQLTNSKSKKDILHPMSIRNKLIMDTVKKSFLREQFKIHSNFAEHLHLSL